MTRFLISTIILVSTVLLTMTIAHGQEFKKDWTNFHNVNWTIKFSAETYMLANNKTSGQLIFQNKKDTTLIVRYAVYKKIKAIDYEKMTMDYYIVQSCITTNRSQNPFVSFDYNGFYYLLGGCQKCFLSPNADCDNLSIQLNKYWATASKKK